jgi:hypothetical protein
MPIFDLSMIMEIMFVCNISENTNWLLTTQSVEIRIVERINMLFKHVMFGHSPYTGTSATGKEESDCDTH